jgi:hypothetical protein
MSSLSLTPISNICAICGDTIKDEMEQKRAKLITGRVVVMCSQSCLQIFKHIRYSAQDNQNQKKTEY